MEPPILFEDEHVLAIDKPTGMVVNRAESVRGITVQDWVEKNIEGEISGDEALRNGIVHRIDKETSGVLLVAKTKEAFQKLQKQFKDREVEKTYTALVHGKVAPPEGTVKAPVGRLPWNRERFGVLPGGREAETGYNVVGVYKKDGQVYSLVEWYPKTGRTHQIRVHAKHLGYPLVSDTFYAGRKTSRADRQWCPRLFLHASRIIFTHPQRGERTTIEASLPQELNRALEELETSA